MRPAVRPGAERMGGYFPVGFNWVRMYFEFDQLLTMLA